MSWVEIVLSQLKDVYTGSPWYGKPVRTILREIMPEKAGVRPDDSSHSVFQLAQHMLTWRSYVVEQLKGNERYQVPIDSEKDWSQTGATSAAEWIELLHAFDDNQKTLLDLIQKTSTDTFEKQVPGKSYGFKHLIEGIVHHDIYHAGQIVTTAKVVGAYLPSS
ncbi:DinB family protein [uncultured Imperialibacter sp.]|uniref:DinB family protein n=1 Tax=uncultured Imperialibacter sp. TaxID=1672639 RepID=UPI0030DB07EA|tara:strand:+ start:1011 stop:1499 length:489 start_codon:yes stop_codon:yes gene_type:complete